MIQKTISFDVRSYLMKVVQDTTTNWEGHGFHRVVTYIDEALTLYQRNQRDNREFPKLLLDSKVKDDKPFLTYQGFDYYWFLEDFQEK